MLKFGRQNVPDTTDAGGRGARSGARSNDPTDDLKRKARQRLIGAVILVLTAIIIVPMLLDSEPRPLGQDIAITIPPKDTPFNPKPATPSGDAAPASTGASAPANLPTAPAIAPAVTPTPTEAAPVAATRPDAIKPDATKPDATKPDAPAVDVAKPAAAATAPINDSAARPATASKPGTSAKPDAASKPEPAKPAATSKPAEADKALALLEGKPASAKPAAASGGKFVVQVGAFASDEKVRELQNRLKTAGVTTYTEKVKTDAGERIRLRAGPYATRADADSVLGKIKAAGINGAAVMQ